jgi:hypothetical protein
MPKKLSLQQKVFIQSLLQREGYNDVDISKEYFEQFAESISPMSIGRYRKNGFPQSKTTYSKKKSTKQSTLQNLKPVKKVEYTAESEKPTEAEIQLNLIYEADIKMSNTLKIVKGLLQLPNTSKTIPSNAQDIIDYLEKVKGGEF